MDPAVARELSIQELRAVIHAVPAPLVVVETDSGFTIVAASDEYLRVTMMSRSDLIGRSIFAVFTGPHPTHGETMDNLRASFQRVLATGLSDSMPVQHYDLPRADAPGGFEERYWSPVNSPVLGERAGIRFIIHRVEDVTAFVQLKRKEDEIGRLAEAERSRVEKIEAELFLRSRELAHVKELTQQRHLLTLLAEQSQECIGIFDLSGKPVYANRTALGLSGAGNLSELKMLPMEDCFIAPERDLIRDTVLPAARTLGRWEGELHFQHLHTQEDVPVLYSVFRVDDPDTGEPTHLAAIGHDLRERKLAEKALRESETRFRRAFAEAPIGMVLLLPHGEIIEANPAFLNMVSYTREEISSADSKVFTHPDDIEPTLGFLRDLREGRRTTAVLEKRYVRKDGQIVWGRASGSIQRDRDGKPSEMVAIIEDITDRKRLEQALIESRARLQQVLAQAPVGVCVMRGRDLVVEMANPFYVLPKPGPEIAACLHRVLDTGEPFAASEFPLVTDRQGNGFTEPCWFNLLYHPLRESDGSVSGIVGVAVDVTPQVLARQEQERLNRELEEFAYVASHDLQEPLRMVNIYTEMILKELGNLEVVEGADLPKLDSYANFVHQGVIRMETLIRDLLTFSRTVQRHEQPAGAADLNSALAEAMSVLRNRLEESGATVFAGALPVVRGDTGQMAHVFQNLLSNAVKYRRPKLAPEIHIAAIADGNHWTVSIRDNGIGFDQRYAERIFGLFKRLHKDAYPGTGLGLAICQRIVERYGGRIWAEGRPDDGATFYFRLPV